MKDTNGNELPNNKPTQPPRQEGMMMEWLLTYGWAILVVLAAIGALAYFGVLSPYPKAQDFCAANNSVAQCENTVRVIGDDGVPTFHLPMSRTVSCPIVPIDQQTDECVSLNKQKCNDYACVVIG